jgi:cytochrome P450
VLQPFSVGPRNCIGKNLAYAEMRLILAGVLWNYNLKLVEDKWAVGQQKIFFFWNKPPLNVIVEKRET